MDFILHCCSVYCVSHTFLVQRVLPWSWKHSDSLLQFVAFFVYLVGSSPSSALSCSLSWQLPLQLADMFCILTTTSCPPVSHLTPCRFSIMEWCTHSTLSSTALVPSLVPSSGRPIILLRYFEQVSTVVALSWAAGYSYCPLGFPATGDSSWTSTKPRQSLVDRYYIVTSFCFTKVGSSFCKWPPCCAGCHQGLATPCGCLLEGNTVITGITFSCSSFLSGLLDSLWSVICHSHEDFHFLSLALLGL